MRNFNYMLLCYAVAAVAQEAPLNADEAELSQMYGGQEMVSVATGSKLPVGKAPAVASVITAEDIKAMGATDIDEVLEAVPGMHVAKSTTSYNPTLRDRSRVVPRSDRAYVFTKRLFA